jgi:type IV/VI secretion system ImpK/VasF family protein
MDTAIFGNRDGEGSRISLAEACAPIFLHLTAFRRNAATSPLSIQELQDSLKRYVEAVRGRCGEDRRLGPLFERVLYALVTTVDQVVLSSMWAQRAGWSMNLLEFHYFSTSEGGSKFFRLVDEVLNDPTEEAAELAEVLFSCMALGFQGELLGEKGELERRRRQLYEKARLPGALGNTLTPDAYGRNVTRDPIKLPTAGILRLVLVGLAAILFAVLAGNSVTKFKNRTVLSDIDTQLEELGVDED